MKENWCYKSWLSRAVCVKVVWAYGENGGSVGVENIGCDVRVVRLRRRPK